jgi:hypothetical protein
MDTYVKRPQCYNGQRVRLLIPDFLLGQAYVFVSITEMALGSCYGVMIL